MSQEIKIGVNADTGAAVNRVRDMEKATDRLADALNKVGQAGHDAARGVNDFASNMVKVKAAQAILTKEFGSPISEADTKRVLENFERMRSGGGLGARRIRIFDDFSSWYSGHARTFARQADAERHRRFVMGAALQGTTYAEETGPPGYRAPPPPTGGGGRRGGGSEFSRGVARAQSSAMSFVKGGLALAGIGSVMGMLGSAVNSAAEEGTGIDTLKRRLGDLGYDFEELRKNVRSAADGLGITYVEAARLAQQFARVSGSSGGWGAGQVNTAMGFSRAFGLDPAEGVQFFASMRRLGATGQDDQSSRKLASMIADSISKGGYMAKADEVLRAVADFAQETARSALAAPNVGAYAANFSGLTGSGIPGLDPGAATSILSRANSAMIRGGAMGEASMNLLYAALGRGHDPIWAQSLMAGGLFGTEASVFGKGTAAGGFFYGANGIQGGSNVTNWERVRGTLTKAYGSKSNPYLIDAIKNTFGLSTPQEAMALLNMTPQDVTASQKLIERSGIDPEKVSPSAQLAIAKIAGAKNGAEIEPAFRAIWARKDVSQKEKDALGSAIDAAVKSGDLDKAKEALTRVYAEHGQDSTQGSETRAAVVDLKDTLTSVGDKLLDPLNEIRNVVVSMADKFGINGTARHDKEFNVVPFTDEGVKNTVTGTAGGNDKKQRFLSAWLALENGGYGKIHNQAMSWKGASGAYQFLRGTWKDFGEGDFSNARDFDKATAAAGRMYDWMVKKYGTDDPRVLAAYVNGGDRAARAVLKGHLPPAKETRDYLSRLASLPGMTPPGASPLQIPADGFDGDWKNRTLEQQIKIMLSGQVELPVVQGGQPVPGARLKAMTSVTSPSGGLSVGGAW